MARNSEKAQSMLFRFREQQAADLGIIDAGRTSLTVKFISEGDLKSSLKSILYQLAKNGAVKSSRRSLAKSQRFKTQACPITRYEI